MSGTPIPIPDLSLPSSAMSDAYAGAGEVLTETLAEIDTDASSGAVSNIGGPVVLGLGGDDDWMRDALEFVSQAPAAVPLIGRATPLSGRTSGRAGSGNWLITGLLIGGVALGGWWLWTRLGKGKR